MAAEDIQNMDHMDDLYGIFSGECMVKMAGNMMGQLRIDALIYGKGIVENG